MYVPTLFTFIGGVIFFLLVLARFPRTRRFYEETGKPMMLLCTGVWLGILLKDKPPWESIAYITIIVVITAINWKKLIDTVASLFRPNGVQ